jgi:catechol 2,3-dioxygenase-like lactoylglutathione lyase family enzyme
MQSISPNIYVKDLPATIEYYKQLGFEVTVTVPETGDLIFAMMGMWWYYFYVSNL